MHVLQHRRHVLQLLAAHATHVRLRRRASFGKSVAVSPSGSVTSGLDRKICPNLMRYSRSSKLSSTCGVLCVDGWRHVIQPPLQCVLHAQLTSDCGVIQKVWKVRYRPKDTMLLSAAARHSVQDLLLEHKTLPHAPAPGCAATRASQSSRASHPRSPASCLTQTR